MHRNLLITSLVVILVGFGKIYAAGGDDAPDWLRQLASQNPGSFEKAIKAVVLLKEETITLNGGNRMVTTDRYAVRVLTREGRKEAVAVIPYLSNFTDVRDFQGWLLAPGGTVTSYGKKDIIDQVSDPEDVYNETRLKIIDGSAGADVGFVFG